MQYNFEWNPNKAKANWVKHKVRFEHAATVFSDSRAISIYDEVHSGDEDRWLTLGLASTGVLLVVHHTFEEVDDESYNIRIISSRKATKNEKKQYKEI